MGCGTSKPTAPQSKPISSGPVAAPAPAPAPTLPVKPVAAKPAAAAVEPAGGADLQASVGGGNPKPAAQEAKGADETDVTGTGKAVDAAKDNDARETKQDAQQPISAEAEAEAESSADADAVAAGEADATDEDSHGPVRGDGSVADFYNRGREAVMGGADDGDDPGRQSGSSQDEGTDTGGVEEEEEEEVDAGFGSDAEGDGFSMVGSSAESAGMSGTATSVGGATGAGNESAGGASSTRAVLAADAERVDLGAALADGGMEGNSRRDLTAEQSTAPETPDRDPVTEATQSDDAQASPSASPGRTPKHVPEASNKSYIKARDSFRMLESKSAVQRAEEQEASRDLESRRQARMASQWNASTEKGVQEMAAARAAAALANPDMPSTRSALSWRDITARAVIDSSSMAKAGDTRRRFSTMAKSALIQSRQMGDRRMTDSNLKPRTGGTPKAPMTRHLSASHIKPATPPQPPALPKSPARSDAPSGDGADPENDASGIAIPDIVATVLELPAADEDDRERAEPSSVKEADNSDDDGAAADAEANLSTDDEALVRVGSMGRR